MATFFLDTNALYKSPLRRNGRSKKKEEGQRKKKERKKEDKRLTWGEDRSPRQTYAFRNFAYAYSPTEKAPRRNRIVKTSHYLDPTTAAAQTIKTR